LQLGACLIHSAQTKRSPHLTASRSKADNKMSNAELGADSGAQADTTINHATDFDMPSRDRKLSAVRS
jgi:hypothetical protein